MLPLPIARGITQAQGPLALVPCAQSDNAEIKEASAKGGKPVKREVYKFLSGVFAGLALAHLGFALFASKGVVNEPIFLGIKWSIGFAWTEVAVYSALSLVLGYLGWRSAPVGSGGHSSRRASQ